MRHRIIISRNNLKNEDWSQIRIDTKESSVDKTINVEKILYIMWQYRQREVG